ncbi:hypothetical protein GOV08_01700, partial [Candidatus Woesearchaeota archaeon]|nr:hypothetical protein [Candidatus Woesearchaeota archaeon]
MLGEINEYLNEIEIILKEIESYESFKKRLLKDLKILYQQYEAGRYDYARYKKIREKILRGKTKKEAIEYFNSIILSLTKKIEYLNAQLFTAIYKEEPEKRKVEAQKKTVRITLPKHADKEKPSIPGMPIDLKET